MSEQDQSAVFAVESPIGVINVVIDGVDRGGAYVEGEVIVNRIPHKVSRVSWTNAHGNIYVNGYRWGIQRVDKSTYGSEPTYNAAKKIMEAIQAAVAQVRDEQGANFQHLGRLAEVRLAKNTHEAEAKSLRSHAEDLIKKAALEDQAVAQLEATLYYLNNWTPEQYAATEAESFARGQQCAEVEIADLGGTPEGEGWEGFTAVYKLQRAAENKLTELERSTPVAHIASYGEYAYLKGYITTCEEAQEAIRRREVERQRAS